MVPVDWFNTWLGAVTSAGGHLSSEAQSLVSFCGQRILGPLEMPQEAADSDPAKERPGSRQESRIGMGENEPRPTLGGAWTAVVYHGPGNKDWEEVSDPTIMGSYTDAIPVSMRDDCGTISTSSRATCLRSRTGGSSATRRSGPSKKWDRV